MAPRVHLQKEVNQAFGGGILRVLRHMLRGNRRISFCSHPRTRCESACGRGQQANEPSGYGSISTMVYAVSDVRSAAPAEVRTFWIHARTM